MKEQILLNGITNDISPTLLAGYYKYGVATLITGNFGTSGGAILEIETMQELINTDSNGISRTIVAQYGAKGYKCLFRNDGFGITGVMEEVEPKIAASRGRGKGWQQQLEINDSGTSNTITSVNKDKLLIEPNVLRMERTEQCKQLRKMNGDKGMKFNAGNKEYSPRTDGVSNTLSTSTKDNMLAMPELRMEDGCMVDKEGRKYRIRKLTPTECFRLQDVSDEDIEKMKQARIAKTNLYKLAGNSICVVCMFHIFRKLFIEKECENQQLELF